MSKNANNSNEKQAELIAAALFGQNQFAQRANNHGLSLQPNDNGHPVAEVFHRTVHGNGKNWPMVQINFRTQQARQSYMQVLRTQGIQCDNALWGWKITADLGQQTFGLRVPCVKFLNVANRRQQFLKATDTHMQSQLAPQHMAPAQPAAFHAAAHQDPNVKAATWVKSIAGVVGCNVGTASPTEFTKPGGYKVFLRKADGPGTQPVYQFDFPNGNEAFDFVKRHPEIKHINFQEGNHGNFLVQYSADELISHFAQFKQVELAQQHYASPAQPASSSVNEQASILKVIKEAARASGCDSPDQDPAYSQTSFHGGGRQVFFRAADQSHSAVIQFNFTSQADASSFYERHSQIAKKVNHAQGGYNFQVQIDFTQLQKYIQIFANSEQQRRVLQAQQHYASPAQPAVPAAGSGSTSLPVSGQNITMHRLVLKGGKTNNKANATTFLSEMLALQKKYQAQGMQMPKMLLPFSANYNHTDSFNQLPDKYTSFDKSFGILQENDGYQADYFKAMKEVLEKDPQYASLTSKMVMVPVPTISRQHGAMSPKQQQSALYNLRQAQRDNPGALIAVNLDAAKPHSTASSTIGGAYMGTFGSYIGNIRQQFNQCMANGPANRAQQSPLVQQPMPAQPAVPPAPRSSEKISELYDSAEGLSADISGNNFVIKLNSSDEAARFISLMNQTEKAQQYPGAIGFFCNQQGNRVAINMSNIRTHDNLDILTTAISSVNQAHIFHAQASSASQMRGVQPVPQQAAAGRGLFADPAEQQAKHQLMGMSHGLQPDPAKTAGGGQFISRVVGSILKHKMIKYTIIKESGSEYRIRFEDQPDISIRSFGDLQKLSQNPPQFSASPGPAWKHSAGPVGARPFEDGNVKTHSNAPSSPPTVFGDETGRGAPFSDDLHKPPPQSRYTPPPRSDKTDPDPDFSPN